MTHDAPLVFYPAFLIDQAGYTPYREVYINSLPGSLALHVLVGRLIDYSDGIRFRLVDLALLSWLLICTWGIMRRWGRLVAGTSSVLFGLVYLQQGPVLSFQRDYLGLILVVTAVWLAVIEGSGDDRPAQRRLLLRAGLIGLIFGLATTIKPHLALGGPAALLYLIAAAHARSPRRVRLQWGVRMGAAAVSGWLLPLVVAGAWLWQIDAWSAFRSMFVSHLPLYLTLSGEHRVVPPGIDRWLYNVTQFSQFGGFGVWLAPAALGVYRVWFTARDPRRRHWLLLLILLAVYAFYVVLGAKFWTYHWLPAVYFLILLSSLALVSLPDSMSRRERLFPVLVLFAASALALAPSNDLLGQLWGRSPRSPSDGRVDAIVEALRPRLQPRDTVQALDWTGGALHGMLLLKARTATPFVEDYVFYHHVSHPYIQGLRSRFIACLEETKPRFILEVLSKPTISGPDATMAFPELRQILASDYVVIEHENGWLLYQRQGEPMQTDIRCGL